MPTPTKGPRLGGGPAHERLILANLATQLFEHDRITTTEAKAKRLRPLAERLITFAKRGDLHARRRVLTVVRDKGVVHRLFTEIAVDMELREGGYTRITKIGPRKGDNAPMAVIELVREPLSRKQATVAEAEAATRRSAKDAAGASGAATAKSEVAEAREALDDVAAVDAVEAVEAAETDAAASDDSATDAAASADSSTTDASAPVGLLDAAGGESVDAGSEELVVKDFGPGSHAPLPDGTAPEGFPIKGNADSMLFHEPDGRWYDATVAEVWFATPEAAEAAGFKKAGS